MRLRLILLTTLLGISAGLLGVFVSPARDLVFNREGQEKFRRQSELLGGRAFLLPLTQTNYLPVRDFNVPESVLNAKAAALFDVQSGRFLYSKNVNQRLPIASITKLMSAIVVLENLNLNNTFVVHPEDINVDGRGADFYKNEQLRGSDLFRIMLINSSNDAALAFATAARALGVDFVAKMNEKAQALGMFNTRFADPAGLNDQETFSTVLDLVKLVRCASEYNLILQALITRSATVASVDVGAAHNLVNTNRLFGQIPGVILGKTGYTDDALGTMVLEIGIGNGRDAIIGVVLGTRDRFLETEKLIQWGKTAHRWE